MPSRILRPQYALNTERPKTSLTTPHSVPKGIDYILHECGSKKVFRKEFQVLVKYFLTFICTGEWHCALNHLLSMIACFARVTCEYADHICHQLMKDEVVVQRLSQCAVAKLQMQSHPGQVSPVSLSEIAATCLP